ncbi:MAG: TetR/AcrR family transcriptional regulator [Eubacterium sp.]|nr:TetR/AcrR family transcriptional regulator [Eubacterium sp.]
MSVENVKEKILKEALRLFADRGYGGVAIGEIAEACDMKTPNLYKYYGGKSDIYEAIKAVAEDSYKRKMRIGEGSMVWIHNGEELKEFSMHQIKFTIQNEMIRNIRKLCTIEQFRDEFLCSKLSEKQYKDMCDQYEEVFAGLMEKGVIEKGDPEMLALEYFSPITVILQECDRYPEKIDDLLEKAEKYIDYFIEKTFV